MQSGGKGLREGWVHEVWSILQFSFSSRVSTSQLRHYSILRQGIELTMTKLSPKQTNDERLDCGRQGGHCKTSTSETILEFTWLYVYTMLNSWILKLNIQKQISCIQDLICAADDEEAMLSYRRALENSISGASAAHPYELIGEERMSLAKVASA